MYKYNKLRGRIIEKFGSFGCFAKEIGLSNNSLSKKLTGKTGISQEDIEKWSDLLDIETSEYGVYFFN